MFEISLREIRPRLRNARIISTSAEFTKIGAVNLEFFFALVVDELFAGIAERTIRGNIENYEVMELLAL
jgi:hypothetical protein